MLQPPCPRQHVRQVEETAERTSRGEHHQRARHHPGCFVQLFRFRLTSAIGPVEGVEHEAGHVERREQCRYGSESPNHVEQERALAARKGFCQYLILREEPRESRHTGNRKCRDPHDRRGPRHELPEAAHVPHILGVFPAVRVMVRVMHDVNHAPRAKKQERLEERVRNEMKDSGRVGAHTHSDEHEAQLGHRGIRQHLLDIPLLEGDRRGEQGGDGTHQGDHCAGDRGHRKQNVGAGYQVHASRHHRCRVDQCGHRCGTCHGVREPGVERDLGRLTDAAEKEKECDERDLRSVGDKRSRRGLEDLQKIQRPNRPEDHEHGQQQPEVADPVHDERLLTGSRLGLVVEPEPDEEVAAETHAFPPDEQDRKVGAEHQHQHEEDKQVQVGEIAWVRSVLTHVSHAEHVDQGTDTGHYHEHHGRQLVDLERQIDLQLTNRHPRPHAHDVGRVMYGPRESHDPYKSGDEGADQNTDAYYTHGAFRVRPEEAQPTVRQKAQERQQHREPDHRYRAGIIHEADSSSASRAFPYDDRSL